MKCNKPIIYLDNAATTRVKPKKTRKEIIYYLTRIGVGPGRSHSRLTRKCENRVNETRELISDMFNLKKPNNVIFTSGATESLNLIIKGVLVKGDHVISTCFDHNSVLRPIMQLKESGVEATFISNITDEKSLLTSIKDAIKPNTKLIVINHASNVTGEILPVIKIVTITKERHILSLLDCAQTAGKVKIDVQELGIDFAVMSGHKALLGPTGIGFVLVNNTEVQIKPLKQGGTGLQSELLEPFNILPNAYEAGTINSLGIYGLYGSLKAIQSKVYKKRIAKMYQNYNYLINELKKNCDVKIHLTGISEQLIPSVSISVIGKQNKDVEEYLESKYGIVIRSGLHCAPLIHKELGTYPNGLIRISLSVFNTRSDIQRISYALKNINKMEVNEKLNYPKKPTFKNLKHYCLFCNPKIHGQEGLVLLRTPHFYLFAPLGAIINGYIIITPYSCTKGIMSMSELPINQINEVYKLRELVSQFYLFKYGHPGLSFEHGRAGSCLISKHGTKHCYHGHLCCFPGIVDNDLGLPIKEGFYLWEAVADYRQVETNGLYDLKEKVKSLPYLFIEHYIKTNTESQQYIRKSKAVIINNEDKLESQYLRKILAYRIDQYELWDWREHPKLNEAKKVVKEFKHWYQSEKDRFDIETVGDEISSEESVVSYGG